MVDVPVQLPALLADSVGMRSFMLSATTVREALAAIRREQPRVAVHVFDDAGAIRRHVLIFYNDTSTRHLETLETPLSPGDKITIIQAISGG